MSPELSKTNLDAYLLALAKEYRKLDRKRPVEVIIVGGASILLNYSFRQMTMDLDCFSSNMETLTRAARNVAQQQGLPHDWVNSDFLQTTSFSSTLRSVSKPYRTLNNGMFEVRTVTAEYLIAMKLAAFRPYKHDRSDIVGILLAEKQNGNNLTEKDILSAFSFLYSPASLSKEAHAFLDTVSILSVPELEKYQNKTEQDERLTYHLTKYLEPQEDLNQPAVEAIAAVAANKSGMSFHEAVRRAKEEVEKEKAKNKIKRQERER